ncbi:MAG: lipase family alpha/beta hydrolase, partial [Cytophagales bacterium]
MKVPTAVILVHGFLDRHVIFRRMGKFLVQQGFNVYDDLNLKPNTGKHGIENLALQLASYIETHIPKGQSITIVGFSMGGLVARYYIQNLNKDYIVKKLITIAAPHHGTLLGYLLPIKSCIQLRPKSEFLRILDNDMGKLKDVQVTSIWARFDTMIVPNKSSHLPFGSEIILPFGLHFILPLTKRVI